MVRTACYVLVITFSTITAASATETQGIVVTGARTGENHTYFTWTITNNGNQPIMMFRVPYYRGRVTAVPEGWTQRPPTGPIGEDQKTDAPILELASVSRANAIQSGQTAEFQVWDPQKRGTLTRQAVCVELADGTDVLVCGVRCPARESFLQRNYPLVGLGAIFAVYLIVKALRGGKNTPAQAAPPG